MSRRRFADLADAGRQLGAALTESYGGHDDALILGIEPHGLVVGQAAAQVLGLPVLGLAPDGPAPAEVVDRVVLVVDDGVESGGTATRLAALLRASGPARLVLAVPVCPREPYSALTRSYDEVIALERPFMVRSLAWHYVDPPDPGGESAGS